MTQIHIITAPDLLLNNNYKILMVYPDDQIKTDFNKHVIQMDHDIYLYESADIKTDWLIQVANLVDGILLNADRMKEDRWLLGYLLSLNHTYYFTADVNDPYVLLNKNRIFDCEPMFELIKKK